MKGIICIGRQYGSGGREVGEKLARKLGIPCYDKLLIKKAALESGLSTDFISKTEESPINSYSVFKRKSLCGYCKHWQYFLFREPGDIQCRERSDRKDRKTGSMCDHWSLCCFHDPEGEQTVCIYLFR